MLLRACWLAVLGVAAHAQRDSDLATSTLNYNEFDPQRPVDPSLAQYGLGGQNYRNSAFSGSPAFDSDDASTPYNYMENGPNPFYNQYNSQYSNQYDPFANTPDHLDNNYHYKGGPIVEPPLPSPVHAAFEGPAPPQPVYSKPERIPMIVDVEWLNAALLTRKANVRILDVTPSAQKSPQDYKLFRDQYYAKWDRLFTEKVNLEFQRMHIPNAVHFNLDIATYPAWNDASALYSPELFQEYVRRLGVNHHDHLVVYSRGSLGGVLESARVWNMFRIYGHNQVSVLDGGLDRWMASNHSVTDTSTNIVHGNWTAGFNPKLIVSYDDLLRPDQQGECLLQRLYWYNFLDARPKPEFLGLAAPPVVEPGSTTPPPAPSHIAQAKSVPAEDLVRPDGKIYSPKELSLRLMQAGYTPGRESIAAGNTPEEASMVVLALAMTYDPRVRLYNAGIPELKIRSPKLIS